MQNVLDITEVVRRTGLTSRTLRFYEARGLLRPLRTQKGRRLYGSGELERLNQILALKKAGLTVAQIQRLVSERPIDLAALVAAQLEAIDANAAALARAKALLLSVQSRLAAGSSVDVATFCALIHNGETLMEQDSWRRITDRYYSPEARAEWAKRMPPDFAQDDYAARWQELGDRIEAALPLDPASVQAQGFVDEWFALLKPFTEVATPRMWEGATRMYDDMDNWAGEADPGFSKRVWDFIKLASARRMLPQGAS